MKDYGYSEEIDVDWNTPLPLLKDNKSRWQIEQIWGQMNMIADYIRVDRDKLHLLYSPYAEYLYDYDMLYVLMRGSNMSLKDYTYEYIRGLMDDGLIVDICSDYGEPGFYKDNQDDLILTADWNDMADGMQEVIRDAGYSLEWSDEWMCDYDNDLLYRTTSSDPFWESSIFFTESEMLPIADNEDLYIEQFINVINRRINSRFNLEKYGFIDIEEACHQTGMYGIYEYPQEVFDKFSDEYTEMVIQTCSQTPYSVDWKVWGRNPEE